MNCIFCFSWKIHTKQDFFIQNFRVLIRALKTSNFVEQHGWKAFFFSSLNCGGDDSSVAQTLDCNYLLKNEVLMEKILTGQVGESCCAVASSIQYKEVTAFPVALHFIFDKSGRPSTRELLKDILHSEIRSAVSCQKIYSLIFPPCRCCKGTWGAVWNREG